MYYTEPLEKILARLNRVEATGDGYSAECPAHADTQSSLSITERDGKVLLHCHAGCPPQQVVKAAGLKMADLFASKNGRTETPQRRGRIVKTYDYEDEAGDLLYEVCRFKPKTFRQRCPKEGGGWTWALGDTRRVLYKLPELLEADPKQPVFVPEGEKDADRLAKLGAVATCNVGGAGKWKTEYSEVLAGRRVVILPDNDEAGRKHADKVAQSLHGKAESVRILDPPDVPEKGDVSDWLDNGGTLQELYRLAKQTPRYEPAEQEPAESPEETEPSILESEARTEAANARRLVAEQADIIRWCDPWGKWLVWNGQRWATDEERTVESLGKQTATDLWQQLGNVADSADAKTLRELFTFAKATNSAWGIRNMVALARSEPGIPVLPKQLDQNPWLLNLENGTLDLRTGEHRPHDRGDYITKLAPVEYSPEARCPTWMAFLKRILDGNRELAGYLQRLVGYCLTGSTREHVLPFLYGVGANGKSTFTGTILALLGLDYAIKAPAELLLMKRGESHPTERADLHGKRFVVTIEAEDGRRMAESLVKELTGGDRIRARRMREDFWEFAPTHKVWLAANHKPLIRGTDYGIWRRVKLVPFQVVIPEAEQDKDLPEKLKAELPGILNWALAGCRNWQQDGLGEPGVVRDATGEYRADMDLIGQFIQRRCVIGDGEEAGAGALYREYREWCETTGERPVNQTVFGTRLTERGIERRRGRRSIIRVGIKLLS